MKYYSLHSQDYGSGNFPPPLLVSNPPPPPTGYNAPPPPPPQMPYNQGQTPGGIKVVQVQMQSLHSYLEFFRISRAEFSLLFRLG